ncbi:LuxR C-terminal-related transcriptional regulator, partial [Streptomyces sp. NPDC031705]|uniref:response regulator transcription factor n=1 Tax=Streptomyces sp. NPDC031705 TaxID=3155729 RepID=UPI0033D95A51
VYPTNDWHEREAYDFFGLVFDGHPALTRIMMDRMRTPAEALTKRELEVLQLVADGLSNQQISKRLFLSQATVKSHLVHVYAKLGVDSRTSAVAAAATRRLIRTP